MEQSLTVMSQVELNPIENPTSISIERTEDRGGRMLVVNFDAEIAKFSIYLFDDENAAELADELSNAAEWLSEVE